MMRPANHLVVQLCREPVDFRKGINGLSIMVEQELAQNPFSEQLFVFINRARDKLKILYWERNGYCLWQKRLEESRFHWIDPSHATELTGQQLNWLIDGYDINRLTPHNTLNYQSNL